MALNWVFALDSLAANGVIDYDAAAYILDQPARFVGNPAMVDLPMTDISLLPPGTKLKDIPNVDEYENSNKKGLVQPKRWKKWAFASVLLLSAAALVFRKKLSGLNMKNLKSLASTTWNYIKKPFLWIGAKFKKTP